MDSQIIDPYLRPKDGPVVPELESLEVVYAKNQPEYAPLRTLRSSAKSGQVLSRWTLTPDQRKAIADGADIFLSLMTFGGPLQPISMMIAHECDASSVAEVFDIRIPDASLPVMET